MLWGNVTVPVFCRDYFSYALLLAGEFYFQAAADAQPDGSANCGCGTPVADVFGLAKK